MSIMLVLGRLQQEDHKFDDKLGSIVRFLSQTSKQCVCPALMELWGVLGNIGQTDFVEGVNFHLEATFCHSVIPISGLARTLVYINSALSQFDEGLLFLYGNWSQQSWLPCHLIRTYKFHEDLCHFAYGFSVYFDAER